jgi:hypothetical protein
MDRTLHGASTGVLPSQAFPDSYFYLDNYKVAPRLNDASAVLIFVHGGLAISSGVVISENIVLSTLHGFEGFHIAHCYVLIGYGTSNERAVKVKGILKYSYELDYCILQLAHKINASCVASVNFSCSLSHRVFLLHYPGGECFKISDGIVLQSTYYQLEWRACVTTDVISSGGGYFDMNGLLCGIHVAVGRMGNSPIRKVLPIWEIVECEKQLFENLNGETNCSLYVGVVPIKIISCPLWLDITQEEIKIPCIARSNIPGISQYQLTNARILYFYQGIGRLKKCENCFPNDAKTLVSVGARGCEQTGGGAYRLPGIFYRPANISQLSSAVE